MTVFYGRNSARHMMPVLYNVPHILFGHFYLNPGEHGMKNRIHAQA